MISNCPGAQRFKQPYPETIKCHSCLGELEIWTDELSACCNNCGTTVRRDDLQGCFKWCKYANECMGYLSLFKLSNMVK